MSRAAIAGFVTRAEAGLRAPRSRSFRIWPERGGTTGHYAGGPQKVSPLFSGHSRCLQLWKAYQTYHMDTKGWTDIAYTGGFCQHGYAFAGRGMNVRTAANGTASGNSYYYAVVWIGGGSERPTELALDALRWWIATLRDDGGAGMRAVPHSFHKNTACPGSYLRSEMATMDNRQLEPPVEEEEMALSKHTNLPNPSNAVKKHQNALKAWNSDALPRFGADGDFGDETEEWVRKYQAAADVPVTGRIDGVTSAMLMEWVPDRRDRFLTKRRGDRLYAPKDHGEHGGAGDHSHPEMAEAFNGHRHNMVRTGTPNTEM